MGATATKERPTRQASTRGWFGPGGGESTVVQAPAEFRNTNVQACGMWPFIVGSGAPLVGAPVGKHLNTGGTVCCDPISWFQYGNFINNPSQYVLGLPGYGKSSLIRRQLLCGNAFGQIPLVLGDLRPDYVDLIRALGGQVIRIGRGVGYMNVLDPGDSMAAARLLSGEDRERVLAEIHGRRLTMILMLIEVSRSQGGDQRGVNEREVAVLDGALRIVAQRITDRPPVIGDLVAVIEAAPDELRHAASDRGDMNRYLDATDDLRVSLRALLGHGRIGEPFSRQSSAQMRRDQPTVFDLSSIEESDDVLRAAALLACWSTGFATVNIANRLADNGIEPRRYYSVVLDEEHRILRAGGGMVDRIDVLTRLNRGAVVGVTHCTHTMKDLESPPSEQDRAKARGFVERSGIVVVGALPDDEMEKLNVVRRVSKAERDLVSRWPDAGALSEDAAAEPAGRGKFLIKVSGSPGIPIRTNLTPVELTIGDTNAKWHEGVTA